MALKVRSVLYFIYKVASSISYFLVNRITPLGALVLLSLPVILIVFITYYKLATLYFLLLVCSMLLFSLTTAFLKMAKLKLRRELPSVASAGQEFLYKVYLENVASSTMKLGFLIDRSADPRPTKIEFLHSREPHEHLRNAFDRLFAYYRWLWLCRKKTTFKSSPKLIDTLQAGAKKNYIMSCTPLQRGKLEFGAARMAFPDALHLFQKCIKVTAPRDFILVLPKRYRLPSILVEGSAREHLGGLSYSHFSGVSDDFRGLRPYRPGDAPKHIDWAAWARTGKPIVREYENVFFPRYVMILDTNGSYEFLEHFEEAISIAASFAQVVVTQECLLDCIFLNKGSRMLTVGKDIAKPRALLEHLASLEIELNPDWEELYRKVRKFSPSLTTCIVVLTRLSDERFTLIKDLRRAGIRLLILVLVHDESSQTAALDVGVIPIRVSSVQQDLLKML